MSTQKQAFVQKLTGPTGLAGVDPMLKRFLVAYRDTGRIPLAAEAAGISVDYAYNLLSRSDIQALLRQSMQTALQDDAQAARRFLRSILDGTAFGRDEARRTTDNALKLRAEAAKALLDRAGYVPPRAVEPGASATPDPSEMSSDELRTFIKKAEAQLSDRAQPVVEPNHGGSSPQVLDMLG